MRIPRPILAGLALLLLGATISCRSKVQVVSSASEAQPFHYVFKGALDETVWEKARYTFEGNATVSDPDDVVPGSEHLSLRIRKMETPRENRSYSAGGLRSLRRFTYGTFTVSMRVPIPSGTVGSFFLMNPWQPGHWLHKEIDFEFLGKNRHAVQVNLHKFWADTESAAGRPLVWEAPFDYGGDFHEYTVVWKPDIVEWRVDGVRIHASRENVPDGPMNMLMNVWVPDPKVAWAADWVGPFDEGTLPVTVEYRWVRYEPLPGTGGRLNPSR
jgi:beta-glucanase (GH16 family)